MSAKRGITPIRRSATPGRKDRYRPLLPVRTHHCRRHTDPSSRSPWTRS